MLLDLPTLYCIAALALIVAGMTQLIPSLTGRSDRSATWWAAGHLLMGVANLLIVAQDHLPTTRLGYWPNVVHITAYGLILQGIRLFDQARARFALVFVMILICSAPTLLVSADAHAFRNGYMNAVRAGWDVAVAICAIRIARQERLHTAWITAFLFGATVPLFLGRSWLAWSGQLGNTVFGPQRGPAIWLAAGAISFVIFRGFCIAMLAAERGRSALIKLAQRDPLTGAYNRAKLDTLGPTLVNPASFVMIDLDRFKLLNDQEGHLAGDAALRLAANLASAIVGRDGHVLRMGGDEFLCILPGASGRFARAIGERLSREFADEIVSIVGGTTYPTLSIGIATGDAGQQTETLLREADDAMYAAKAIQGGLRGRRTSSPLGSLKASPETDRAPVHLEKEPSF